MDLAAYLSSKRELVDAELERRLPSIELPPSTLHDSIRYSVLAPGKRIRPILVVAAAEAVGGAPEDVLPTACALELIHVFSLIHDDLPCMDDDDYRRGRLTNHKVYGDAMAMLSGDALLAMAFELMALNVATVDAARIVPAIRMVARAAGTAGMVGGQVVDIQSEGKPIGPDELEFIHLHKTAALLSASVCVGGLLSGATPEEQASFARYGRSIGLAFQIADDILDVVGDQDKIGKPVGSDEGHDKATYPKLFGLEESRRRAHAEVANALEALEGFGPAAEPLRGIARFIVERDL